MAHHIIKRLILSVFGVSEFYHSKPHEKLASWADSFQLDHGVNVWATGFEQVNILSTYH